MQILRGRISQEGDSAPVITLLENPLNLTVTTEYDCAGGYKGALSSPVLNNDNPQKWFIASSALSRYSISQLNPTEFYIQSFTADGQQFDGVLSGNEFSIEI